MNIELIIKGLLSAWMITEFEPLQNILNKLKTKSPVWILWIFVLLSCIKCLSFWITFAITKDVWSAIAASVIAATYDKVIHSFKQYF